MYFTKQLNGTKNQRENKCATHHPHRVETGKTEQDEETLISVYNISKKFCKNLKRSMAYGIFDLSKNFLGVKPDFTSLRKDEFWALKDISFKLKRGEILGLVGPNGSGKSTLLRMLAGIFPPDKGRIEIKGRVGAVIALGAGFHPHMTGRENIYLNGTILGLSRKELDVKFDDIVDFAEIGDFVEAPVSTYSSGMRVRLGFAIAYQLDPDILLIDEILAVGDIGFKAKCYNAIARISSKAAIIFVSHHMPQVARISSKLLLLNRGEVDYFNNDVSFGISKYHSLFKEDNCTVTGSGEAELIHLKLYSNGVQISDSINYLDELTLDIKFRVKKSIRNPVVYVTFLNQTFQGEINLNSKVDRFNIHNESGFVAVKLKISQLNLTPGIHFISVGVHDHNPFKILRQYYAYRKLIVKGDFVGIAPVQLKGEWLAN
jgi:lipopolysaccharide transport system ATP-binding protein